MPTKVPAYVVPQRDLMDIVASGDIVLLRAALADPTRTAHVVEYRDTYGYSALHIGACHGQLECCGLLLQAGIDVKAAADSGVTALHIANANGFGRISEMLLQAGADPTALDSNFAFPALLAERNKHARLVVAQSALVQPAAEKSRTALGAAAAGDLFYFCFRRDIFVGEAEGNPESEGAEAPPTATTNGTATEGGAQAVPAVHRYTAAAVKQDFEAVDPETGNNVLHTALLNLSQRAGVDDPAVRLARFLVENRVVSVNVANKEQLTPLMLASRRNSLAAVSLLLAHGADATATYDPEGAQTAADLAVDRVVVATIVAAAKKAVADAVYEGRNSVPFEARAQVVADIKTLRGEYKAAAAALAQARAAAAAAAAADSVTAAAAGGDGGVGEAQ